MKTTQERRLKTLPKPNGRPTVFTPELVTKLEQAFAIDATVEEACSYADISRMSFYRYLERHPSFSDRITDLRNKPILKARQTVVQRMGESYGNAMDYLKRKRPLEFSNDAEELKGATITNNLTQIIINAPYAAETRDKPNSETVPSVASSTEQ